MKRSPDDEIKFFQHNLHVPTRTVYVGAWSAGEDGEESGVDYVMSEHVIKALHLLDSYDDDPITIIFNSMGGDWAHGMAIYDCIKSLKSSTKFIGYGCVRSMGSIIIQAADIRLLTPYCRFMIHDGSEGAVGKPKDVQALAAEGKVYCEQMYDIYYQALKNDYFKGKSKKKAIAEIELWCALSDKFFSATEAVKMGFVDGIYK